MSKLAIYILNSDDDLNFSDMGFDDVINNAVDFIEPSLSCQEDLDCIQMANLLHQMIIKLNQGEMSDQDYFYLVDLTEGIIIQS